MNIYFFVIIIASVAILLGSMNHAHTLKVMSGEQFLEIVSKLTCACMMVLQELLRAV